MCEVLKPYGFLKLCTLSISEDTNRLCFGKIKRGQYKNIMYAICIDGDLKYLGKTNDFWKRTDTYRNAKYWKTAWASNKNKTEWLEQSVKSGKIVEVFYRQYLSFHSMNAEEAMFIELMNPPWNQHHNKENYEASI